MCMLQIELVHFYMHWHLCTCASETKKTKICLQSVGVKGHQRALKSDLLELQPKCTGSLLAKPRGYVRLVYTGELLPRYNMLTKPYPTPSLFHFPHSISVTLHDRREQVALLKRKKSRFLKTLCQINS